MQVVPTVHTCDEPAYLQLSSSALSFIYNNLFI